MNKYLAYLEKVADMEVVGKSKRLSPEELKARLKTRAEKRLKVSTIHPVGSKMYRAKKLGPKVALGAGAFGLAAAAGYGVHKLVNNPEEQD